MFLLTSTFEDSFDYEGTTLHVDMAFDNILRMFELFEDETFQSYEKIVIALEMLINEYETIENLEFTELMALYGYVMDEFLSIDLEKNEDEEKGKKIMDFAKDAGLIYASFLSEYNMDLFKEQGILHWNKFSMLLANLGDKTAFKQVISYRTMKIPSSKEASDDYRNHVIKMKEAYSLEDEAEKAESLENTLDTIASSFKGGG